MKQFKKIAIFLFAPSAFKIGVAITCVYVYTALRYYSAPSYLLKNDKTLSVIHDLHQKSYDYRLRDRGPRDVSNEIALVVIDDKSLEKIGRWPWPRIKIADMVERLRSYGAKVIAFDAVFSEPEVNPAIKTLNQIKLSGLASSELTQAIDKEIEESNSDLIFAKTVEKHSDHLVMGTYFDPAQAYNRPWGDICEAELLANTYEYKVFENEALQIPVLDSTSSDIPLEFKSYIRKNFEQIQENNKQLASAENWDETHLKNKTYDDNLHFCNEWVTKYTQDVPATNARGLASSADILQYAENIPHNSVAKAGRLWLDIPVIAQGTKHTGYFNAFQDNDGTLRWSNLIARYGNQYVPSIALKTVMLAKNLGLLVKIDADEQNPGSTRISSLELTDPETAEPVKIIPVDGEGRMIINYAGGEKSYPHLSAAELFNGKDTAIINRKIGSVEESVTVNKSEWLKDKILLFGATAIGIYDLRVTPFAENFPGPEVHTNIMDNLLQENYLQKSSREDLYMMGVIVLLGLALSGLISYLGAVIGMLLSVTALLGVYYYDKLFLFKNGIVTTIIFPIFLIGTLYVVLTFYKYLTEERKKKELKGTFAKYVSPSVVNEILKDPSNIELGGKKQRMSVMFSDVRGFTTISEKLEPTKLGDILNMYLTPMTRLVFDYKGTLDKYMGDAIMAFWGAPIFFPDHAIQACRCGLKMMEKLGELNKQFEALGLPHIDIGIGINTGDMSVGNMGSDIVRSYTVMGDSVNLGSRLEGINKEYGTHIIISEFTYAEVKDHFVCREVDWVRVKGKKLPVKIYELISEKTVDQKIKEKVEHFKSGFEYYHQKAWDKAIECFNLSLNVDPDDYTSKLYLKRCTNYKSEPPPEDWDGVFEMKTK